MAPIEILAMLRSMIEEKYKKQFENELDKIPNIRDLVPKWWSQLDEKVTNNIKKMYSEIQNYSEHDRQLTQEEIFKKFKRFYNETIKVNLDEKTDILNKKPKKEDVVKNYVFKTFEKISPQDTSQPPKTNNKTRNQSKDSPHSSSESTSPPRHHKKKLLQKDQHTAYIVTRNDHLSNEKNKKSIKRQPSSVVTQPEPIKELTPYHLKNGVVGKEFSETLDFEKLYPEGKISDFSIDGLDEIGLKFDKDTFVVHGVPKKAGDPNENYEFEITIRFETNISTKGSRKIFIKISPDPKSLWKIIEPPETLGDPKDHEYSKLISLETIEKEMSLLCASKRGRSHAHKATYRDDDVKIEYLQELGWSIIAVADGAGSAKLSRVGSKIACKESVKYISQMLGNENKNLNQLIEKANKEKSTENEALLQKSLFEILAHAAYTSAKRIQTEAENRKLVINDFHTTLLLAIHKQYDFGHFIAGFWIGDGALAIYKNNEPIRLLGKPDGGQYSGQTVFLTMKEYLETEELAKRIRYHIVQDFTAIVAMSDGVSDPEFGTDKNLFDHTCWDKFWEKLQGQFKNSSDRIDKTLLKWLDFWAEGEHDDRSIAILY